MKIKHRRLAEISRFERAFTLAEVLITLGIIGLANLFDPDCVVLSGSMAQFVDTKKIEERVNNEIVTAPTSIRPAQAGNYSGMIGVSLLALGGLE